MKILIDTSVVVRTIHTSSIDHQLAVDALVKVRRQGLIPCVIPQVFYEFWVVVTRPVEKNGLGLSAEQATLEVAQLSSYLEVNLGEDGVFEEWQRLVTQYKVVGKNAHDTRLVAAMNEHGISELLTFNAKDFARFTEITIHTPDKFAARN